MKPDAGRMIDTSCGIDCEAQARYGLLAHTCFEYSDTSSQVSPPALSAEVMPQLELEGGIKVMQVKYSYGGQRKMQDSFTIAPSGDLRLVRREFGAGGTSVSFKNDSMALEGVKWLELGSASGVSYSTTSNADVISGSRMTESTMYRATMSEASSADLAVPLSGGVDGGLKMLFSETPDHGSDSKRVWSPGLGFSLITTPLALSMGTSQEYRLQNVKDTTDGGLCGF